MNVVVINPPLVQLNAPYPSGAYLTSFFKSQGCNAKWYDFSIDLYYSIFSRSGLTKLFELTSQKALKMAEKALQQNDEATAFNLRRYVSAAQNWIFWIDDINAILRGQNREKEHQFLYSPFAPRGSRMENFLANLDHEPTVDDVRFLCSYAIADLADYITAVFDPDFSLIHYAQAVADGEITFSQIEKKLDAPVLNHFYKSVLENLTNTQALQVEPVENSSPFSESSSSPELFLISIPFAGTFMPAIYTARFLRQKFPNAKIAIGGGYVNTQMREWNQAELGKYVDFISYDRGYGSYVDLLERWKKLADGGANLTDGGTLADGKNQLYKMTQFESQKDAAGKINYKITLPLWKNDRLQKLETQLTRTTFPDYSDIDFSRYPRVCDDKNPMHRLWSDGAWLKAYLAHGCYWHNCAFCDTRLDYVCGYKIVDVEALYEHLLKTARAKGVYGIHFVDEALPPAAVLRFALCNARHGNPLYFWGNVRFEKSWTKDLAALLSACGFGGVSAGIEVATGQGLKNINKGTDIQSIVSACAAFKEAGILVHAYMIYGFWYDTPQTIIDSMETLRQFYQAGLLDSSFWHQFMLTKYSPKYDELKDSFNPKPYQKFGPALDAALASWMHGEKLEMKVQKWFDFSVPAPVIPRDFVENCIENYEEKSNQVDFEAIFKSVSDWTANGDGSCCVGESCNGDSTDSASAGLFWIGSKPVAVFESKASCVFRWFYLQEEFEAELPVTKANASSFSDVLEKLSPSASVLEHTQSLKTLATMPNALKIMKALKNKGLVLV